MRGKKSFFVVYFCHHRAYSASEFPHSGLRGRLMITEECEESAWPSLRHREAPPQNAKTGLDPAARGNPRPLRLLNCKAVCALSPDISTSLSALLRRQDSLCQHLGEALSKQLVQGQQPRGAGGPSAAPSEPRREAAQLASRIWCRAGKQMFPSIDGKRLWLKKNKTWFLIFTLRGQIWIISSNVSQDSLRAKGSHQPKYVAKRVKLLRPGQVPPLLPDEYLGPRRGRLLN